MNLNFTDNAKVSHRYWTPDNDPPCDGTGILIIDFSGKVGNSKEFSGGYEYMTAIIGAGRTVWEPGAIILNLVELEYSWGDEFTAVIGAARAKVLDGLWHDEEIPFAVVVSEKCRDGVFSLITDEMHLNPDNYLVETIPEAELLIRKKTMI